MSRSIFFIALSGLLILAYSSCSTKEDKFLFHEISSEQCGIDFRNDLVFDKDFNIYTYRNFYNGGGVAIGDINNDSLPDIYFTSNQGLNRLYLNLGDFKFQDITEKAGVAGTKSWSTGVSMADVNGDGLLDIYVCNSGDIKNDNKENELFVNNGDLTFTEKAHSYGLDDKGYSTHAAFFDYDKDGDLDMYLLNNSFQAIGSFNLMNNIRNVRDSLGGDKLFRNDGNVFKDVSNESGIYGSVIGFGLGVSIGDLNNDSWLDIYVSNDFFERDYLYLNNGDGMFTEVLDKQLQSISAASMGADIADVNNDGLLDIFTTDMLPKDERRLKQVTTFENYDKLAYNVKHGYHYQFNRNMLQLNNGNGTFSEIGRLAGVDATDWSWGALIFDMDSDGYKDIFVANGIHQDITDLDYLSFIVDDNTIKKIITKKGVDYEALIEPIPLNKVANFAFMNNGDLTFLDKTEEWGLSLPINSNGSAYGDLNNDGYLDLVTNNVNQKATIYRNACREVFPENSFLKFVLKGADGNKLAVGAKISVWVDNKVFCQVNTPNRGFQSSVDYSVVVGLGKYKTVDSIQVQWPNDAYTKLYNVKTNSFLRLRQSDGVCDKKEVLNEKNNFMFSVTKGSTQGIAFKHEENDFIDFDRDKLIFQMLSREGPALAIGDVNKDGKNDFYIGGARGQAGKLYQNLGDHFVLTNNGAFDSERGYEDIDAVFFDLDADGDQDLFVVSGGNEFSRGASQLADRIYVNDGVGNFSKREIASIKENKNVKSVVIAKDFDSDGFVDLFVGERTIPFAYGQNCSGILYRNDGNNNFVDVTNIIGPELKGIGMITDAIWSDYDRDNDFDLLVVGEWMGILCFENSNGKFRLNKNWSLIDERGWWNCIKEVDLNQDGFPDYLLGNHGLNSRFKASVESPIIMYVNDFDSNGDSEHILCKKSNNGIFPYALKHDLTSQIPQLKKKFLKYKDYNDKSITEIFEPAQLEGAVIQTVNRLSSVCLINSGNGFSIKELPMECQLSPIFDFEISEDDILLGGNFYEVKPQIGRFDASFGLVIRGIGMDSIAVIPAVKSGIVIQGAIRKIETINAGLLIVAINNDSVQFISRNKW